MQTRIFTETDDATQEYYLVPDLSIWMPKPVLFHLTWDVARSIDLGPIPYFGGEGQEDLYTTRKMVQLLAYCYATGVYASENIERQLHDDPWMSGLLTFPFPDHDRLRRFRNHHRELVEQCLEKICFRVWKLRHSSDLWNQNDLRLNEACSRSMQLDPLFQLQIICEVRERISKADQLDRYSQNRIYDSDSEPIPAATLVSMA